MFGRNKFWTIGAVLAVAVGLCLNYPITAEEKKEEVKSAAPKVEVVFCLDTTGSMGGLIEGAKQKIWAICNQIASGKPSPDLKVGLVAYRDKGDDYVTKVFDLTDNLDEMHGQLRKFEAKGGGDFPEHVNQALDDSVNKITWSKDDDTLRIIFLVGDAPPHMDYKDDVKYPVTCEKAIKKGIIINTVQCGDNADCMKFWKDICGKSEGSYVRISADGGVAPVVQTPFDKRLAEINGEIASTTVAFGDGKAQQKAKDLAGEARNLPAPAAAERAAYNAKKEQNASYDLLDAVKQKKVKLEDVKKEHLPEEMQKMTLAEQKAHLEKLEKKRADLQKEALDLDKKRSEFIAKKTAENKTKSEFDTQVLEMLRKQAKKIKVDY
ncbi:MAG: VWA domain-containing protein [Gemmataceae bacterium]|nr:VWA domain-containing protein [Gemmataceae bacterium]